MTFSGETRVKDIALSDPSARRILEDSGLDYCCGGGKSLHDACLDANISMEEILESLRTSGARELSRQAAAWNDARLCKLTAHICDKHHRYVRDAIPRLGALLEKVSAKHRAAHPELVEIEGLFGQLAREMITHMQKEEHILFPYIDAMDNAANSGGSLEPPFFQTVRNPIHAMIREHDSAGSLAKQIRSLSSDYTAPASACASFIALYQGLREFEADLHEHVHLENNVLFPRALQMEAGV